MNLEWGKNDYYWKVLRYEAEKKKIEKLFVLIRENSFEPILIKGWAASQNYPNPFERWSVDIDLAINPKDYKNCQEFIKEKNLGEVDLHCGLRHHDKVEWENLFENSRLVKLGGTNVRILRAEDHLRVLCVHWLTHGGEQKERLWDIYWAVENRPANFDWNRCLNVVSDKRKRWITCTINLAHKYLGLDLSDTPLRDSANEIPFWLIKTVEKEWSSGVKLKPLHYCLDQPKELFIQIKKRCPPNPITATVDMDGDFDSKSRIFYQTGDILRRLKPSIEKITKRLIGGK